MLNLIDEREAITTTDIDQAQSAARRFLADPPPGAAFDTAVDLIERLLAIVTNAYGPPPVPVHLMTPDFDLTCGHDGEDPSTGVLAEVTCPACIGVS